jgi:uncharacterized protein (DUF924 family)
MGAVRRLVNLKPPLYDLDESTVRDAWLSRWFAKGKQQSQVDQEMRSHFEFMLDTFVNYEPATLWETMALIILYDQISRNIYRGTPKAYSFDHISRKLALNVAEKHPKCLAFHLECTILIALCHSENMGDQNLLKTRLLHIEPLYAKKYELLFKALHSIQRNHEERICLFGRFPERNTFLGRTSTYCELAYLNALY